MTLQQLRYFCVISKESSFRRAAEILHVSQPSLSNAISRLEEELGFMLFERKGRHIELTKYGRFYHEHIRTLLDRIEFITDKTRTIAKGHIDLAYNVPFGRKLIPNLARGFLDVKQNKKYTFHFHQASSQRIIEGLQNGRFDVGVCSINPNINEVEFVPLMRQDFVAIVPINHELAENESVSLKDLVRFPYVDYADEVGIHSLVHKFLSDEQVTPKITAKAPDEASIAALVANGFGVSFVASIDALRHFDVAILKINRDDCYRTIYMTYIKERYLSLAVKRFIEYCKTSEIISC